MDIDGGLPYEADDSGPTVPPPPPVDVDAGADVDVDMLLDRPLDDLPPRRHGGRERRSREPRSPVPEHVASLMGRMGKGKVYLADESPGIIHHDAERRIARDPRLTRLALELDKQDPTEWLAAVSEGAEAAIRPNALFVSSELIKHLSTAKVFTWASEFGVGIMGIEWLNDSTLILLFPTAAAALLSLSMLAKAGFDPTEGDDPLMERAAHGFPPALLPRRTPTPEPDRRVADLDAELEAVAAARAADAGEGSKSPNPSSDEPVRRGRGAFRANARGSANGAFDLPPLAGAQALRFAEGVDPNARVTVRYATDADSKRKRGAGESSWYAKHGRAAGKETSARRSGGGRWEEPLDLRDRVGTRGEGRDFARRIGRERYEERGDRERGERRGPRRARVEDLDADLDWMARRRGGEEGDDEGRDYGRRYERREREGSGRGGRDRDHDRRGERAPRRQRANQDDLDRELDEMFASRGD